MLAETLRPLRPDLGTHLRAATCLAHERLETSLDLLERIADRGRFRRLLERFYGFHQVWEPALSRHPDIAAFHGPRSRLPHLRRDLAAQGMTQQEIAALPLCDAATGLVRTAASALGSVYVLEGSTLGGQVIARRLADAGWAPGGLAYFEPHGRRTGDLWRGFKTWADARTDEADYAAVAEGANLTFGLLQDWLTA